MAYRVAQLVELDGLPGRRSRWARLLCRLGRHAWRDAGPALFGSGNGTLIEQQGCPCGARRNLLLNFHTGRTFVLPKRRGEPVIVPDDPDGFRVLRRIERVRGAHWRN